MGNSTTVDPVNANTEARPVERRRLLDAAVFGLVVLLVGLLWWFDPSQAGLPLCTFRAMTGFDCPGCGATRATHELLHGRLLAAWRYNSLWVMLLPVAVYVGISEFRVLRGGRPLPGDLIRRSSFWLSVGTMAIVFAVLRNLP
jgi:hypothetical protein